MTDDAGLDETSRKLLGTLGELRALEEQKRGEARSTDAFHELAEEVADKAGEVFALASAEELAGESDSPKLPEREEQFPGDWTRS